MKKLLITSISLLLLCCLSGCWPPWCLKKVVLSGNGNIETGVVGGEIEVEACTPMEKEAANQLKILSDWYRLGWDKCSSDSNPATCREELTKAYMAQKETLLLLIAAMRGQTKVEQLQTYNEYLGNIQMMILSTPEP